MIRDNHILISLLVASTSLLSACGGTSDYSIDPSIETISDLDFVNDFATINSLGIVSDTSFATEPPIPFEGVEPIVPFSSSGISNSDMLSYSQYAGYDADIEATVLTLNIGENSYPTIGFSLADDIDSINITNVQRTIGAEFCSESDPINVIQTTDYSAGISLLTGTARGEDITCATYFTPMIDATVTDADVGDFLNSYGYGEGTNTTCPEDYLSNVINICAGNAITNYTITDDTDAVHNIVKQIVIDL